MTILLTKESAMSTTASGLPIIACPAYDGREAGFGCLRGSPPRGPGAALPLAAFTAEVAIAGPVWSWHLRQSFVNAGHGAQAIEAVYIFPLPPRAAVTGFRMAIAGRTVKGILRERQQAREEYRAAIDNGQRAALLEEERPDIFTVQVGNIQPGETAVVDLIISGPVAVEEGMCTVRLPLVVAPRYIPGIALGDGVGLGIAGDTEAVPDASRISPPVLLPGFPSPVKLAMSIAVAGLDGREGERALSCTLPTIAEGSGRWRVVPGQRLDRDLVLQWQAHGAELSASALVAMDAPGGGASLAITIAPPAEIAVNQAGIDVVILLDRSGSMGGWKMVAARRAAARLVDALDRRDRFAAIAFDDTLESYEGLIGPATVPVGRPGAPAGGVISVMFGSNVESEYTLIKAAVAIGRAMDCDIVVDNLGVSRHHCTIVREGDQWVLVDGNNNNGTFVRGVRVTRHVLKHGDRVVLGKHSLLFDAHRTEALDGADTVVANEGRPVALVPGSDHLRYTATAWLGSIESRGGTELAGALDQAFALLPKGDAGDRRERVLVVITDAQVGDEDRILSRHAEALKHVRVVALGIDMALNSGLLERLVKPNRGWTASVAGEDRLHEALAAAARAVRPATLSAISVTGAGRELAPTPIGDLWPSRPLTVWARLPDGAIPTSVRVHGNTARGAWTQDVLVKTLAAAGLSASDEEESAMDPLDLPMAMHAAWGRARIRDMEDTLVSGGKITAKDIVALSLAEGVLSRFTAFVAIDPRVAGEGRTPARPITVVQAVEQAAGWKAQKPAIGHEAEAGRSVNSRRVVISKPKGGGPRKTGGGMGGEMTMFVDQAQLAKVMSTKRMGIAIHVGGRELLVPLYREECTIGARGADIPVKGFLVKPVQAKVVRHGDQGFRIVAMGGWRAVYVNGEKVRDFRDLVAGDVITIAGVRLVFRQA